MQWLLIMILFFFWLFLSFLTIGVFYSSTMSIDKFLIYTALIIFVIAALAYYIIRSDKIVTLADTNLKMSNVFGYIAAFTFGVFFLGLMATFLYNATQNLNSPLSIIKLILSIIVTLAIIGVVLKYVEMTDLYAESSVLQLFINVCFYLPCLFVNIIDLAVLRTGGSPSRDSIIVLIIMIAVYALYFGFPLFNKWRKSQRGMPLLTDAVNLGKQITVATYDDITQFMSGIATDVSNKISSKESFVSSTDASGNSTTPDPVAPSSNTPDLHYHYGISFSIFMDINDPRDNNISILTFGGKPSVLYNPSKNNFIVAVNDPQTEEKPEIVYETTDLPLQKWNDIIINYDSGIFDVFVNSELKMSKHVNVPFMRYDTITVGQDDGINGGIRNVAFYREPINVDEVILE